MEITKRKFERYNSIHLIAYICLDGAHQELYQGMGRTLNVSVGGIQLETNRLIDNCDWISLRIGLENEIMDIIGNVIYSKMISEKVYISGIRFYNPNPDAVDLLERYIDAFMKLKHSTDEYKGNIP